MPRTIGAESLPLKPMVNESPSVSKSRNETVCTSLIAGRLDVTYVVISV